MTLTVKDPGPYGWLSEGQTVSPLFCGEQWLVVEAQDGRRAVLHRDSLAVKGRVGERMPQQPQGETA